MTAQSFTHLISANHRWLDRKVCGDAARKHGIDRQELFSRLMERIWRARDRFKPLPDATPEESFRRWSITLTYRLAIDMRRSMERSPAMLELDVMHMMAHRYEMEVMNEADHDSIMQEIQAVYGLIAFVTIRTIRDGHSVDEAAALVNRTKPTIYRMLKKIRGEFKNKSI